MSTAFQSAAPIQQHMEQMRFAHLLQYMHQKALMEAAAQVITWEIKVKFDEVKGWLRQNGNLELIEDK